MSTVIDSISIKGLRPTHFHQLMAYIKERDSDGWYYGNKKQFDQRHEDLKEWLQGVIEVVSGEGTVIPKK